jgi:hypothetical protein
MLSSADPALLFPHQGYQDAARDVAGGNSTGDVLLRIAEILSGMPLKLLAAFAQVFGQEGVKG